MKSTVRDHNFFYRAEDEKEWKQIAGLKSATVERIVRERDGIERVIFCQPESFSIEMGDNGQLMIDQEIYDEFIQFMRENGIKRCYLDEEGNTRMEL